ncbi:MAG: DUF4292 domain-containing protein [Prevotella sp.]|nr:DUF4292 domain-containing protein [Prevotella sp.]
MNRQKIIITVILALPFLLGACGSSKKALKDTTSDPTVDLPTVQTTNIPEVTYNYIKKVCDNAVTEKNIVSSIDFNLKSGSKDISVDGKISMKRDEVIRIQLSPMGLVEVGRMEFTPDSVLIMDRIHKQFVKVGYNDVSFLKNNGINFKSLQALFWNQLFVPGTTQMQDREMKMFEKDGSTISISDGKMKYTWDTDLATALINNATAIYNGNSGKSMLFWQYGKFKQFQSSQFPTQHTVKFTISSGKEMTVTINMNGLKNDGGWDVITKVPKKYKPVKFQDVINQIMNIK